MYWICRIEIFVSQIRLQWLCNLPSWKLKKSMFIAMLLQKTVSVRCRELWTMTSLFTRRWILCTVFNMGIYSTVQYMHINIYDVSRGLIFTVWKTCLNTSGCLFGSQLIFAIKPCYGTLNLNDRDYTSDWKQVFSELMSYKGLVNIQNQSSYA